ncbi:hypothetical protein F4861DRAFT_486664 [Xylaria intraflava]|nr:hypothetical protein F4861DRAFT_486664 [Xylaria intraflava]
MSSTRAGNDSPSSSSGQTPYLATTYDWFDWFNMLKFHCMIRGVWEYIDPELPDVTTMPTEKPKAPTRELAKEAIRLDRLDAYNRAREEWTSKPEGPNKGPAPTLSKEASETEIRATLEAQISAYTAKLSCWGVLSENYVAIHDLIRKSVKPMYLNAAIAKVVLDGTVNLQVLVRTLKGYLASEFSVTQIEVQRDYRAILERAKEDNVKPTAWYYEWKRIYLKAQAIKLYDVEGHFATAQFLDAVGQRMAPDWARMQLFYLSALERFVEDHNTLDRCSRRFEIRIHEDA